MILSNAVERYGVEVIHRTDTRVVWNTNGTGDSFND